MFHEKSIVKSFTSDKAVHEESTLAHRSPTQQSYRHEYKSVTMGSHCKEANKEDILYIYKIYYNIIMR